LKNGLFRGERMTKHLGVILMSMVVLAAAGLAFALPSSGDVRAPMTALSADGPAPEVLAEVPADATVPERDSGHIDRTRYNDTDMTAIPEPGSLALFGLGALQLIVRRRRS
jgi:hypothetical protein